MKRNEVVGHRYGQLVVIRDAGLNTSHHRLVECHCDCGRTVVVGLSDLRRKDTRRSRSCGCTMREKLVAANTTHGMTNSPEYSVWSQARRRCHDLKNRNYHYYGGRGIAMCDRWRQSFPAFYADMGPRPSIGHTIDRINNDGPYEPDNCRWATRAQQRRNTRNLRLITYGGETLCLQDWANRIGITKDNLAKRLANGWSLAEALTRPPRR